MRASLAVLMLIAISIPSTCASPTPSHPDWQGARCSTYLQSSRSEREVLNSWILGFIAATNRERPNRQVRLTEAEIEQQATSFCTLHASNPLPDAAFAIVDAKSEP